MTTPVSEFVAPFVSVAVYLAAVSTAAMAFVEFFKSICRARLFFHRWSLRRWTSNKARDALRMPIDIGHWAITAFGSLPKENPVLSEILVLAAGGHDYDKALYDQPAEKMMAQIQAATNVALEFPDEFPHLYAFLTKADTTLKQLDTNTERILSGVAAGVKSSEVVTAETALTLSDAALWRDGKDQVRARAIAGRAVAPPGDTSQAQASAVGQARTRINNLVARKLDAFQNETRYQWDRLNQVMAYLLCTGIIFKTIDSLTDSAKFDGVTSVLLKLLGGILAPFAKDIVAGLASFGKKP